MTRESERTTVGKTVPMTCQDHGLRRQFPPRRIPLVPFVPLNPGESRIKFVSRVSRDFAGHRFSARADPKLCRPG